MSFSDHFSTQANDYATYRPAYPDALGTFLRSIAPGQTQVWDCATGSGQAATMLVRHFDHIVATDASAAQIANADRHDRISYSVAGASASGLPDASCDLVTVAQAAHWLDLPAFYTEARRVLKPDGVIALWCYVLAHTGRVEIDDAIREFQYKRVEPYWPPGRELVEDGYQSLPFPFTRIIAPRFEMTARWRRAELLGYISTWSAVARYRQFEKRDPLVELTEQMTRLWPDDNEALEVHWPLYVLAGRT